MPPYETYAAPGGRRLTVWRAERRSFPAGRASAEHLLRAPPRSWRWSVPRAPRSQSLLAHGARGGDPVRVPRGLRRLFPEARRPCHPTQTLSPLRSYPRQRRRGAPPRGRPAASPFFGEGVEGRGRPELEGEPLDLHQPLVLGLLDLAADDIAVGAHETKVRPQIHSTSFLCRSSTSAT